jgi:hypothetical protein
VGRLFLEVDKWDDETLILRDPDDRKPIWGTISRSGLTAYAPTGSGPFDLLIDRSGEITPKRDFGCAKACVTYVVLAAEREGGDRV